MPHTEIAFQEFVDAVHAAKGDGEFERVAARTAQGLGFRISPIRYIAFDPIRPANNVLVVE